MARRKAKRNSMKKLEPAVQNVWIPLPSWDGINQASANHYVDLSQVASLVNRRFYRQGLNWAVAGFKIHFADPAQQSPPVTLVTTPSISINKLPNTWVLSNAWEKGMRAWLKMVRESSSETPSVRPRFLDFKVYADATHHAKGSGTNLLPINTTAGEWSYSKISHPLSDGAIEGRVIEEDIIAVGANYPGVSAATGLDAVSLIEGYAASRGLPNIADPNVPDDARDTTAATPENWMSAMFNEGTDQDFEVIGDLITENTIAPYPFENDGVHTDTMYPGGANQQPTLEVHAYKAFAGATVGNMINLQGGNFPCGLINIYNQMKYENADATTAQLPALLQIMLVPGPHRGYMCQDMKDM